jgi:cobyrinic acid a,c-diamide synthase
MKRIMIAGTNSGCGKTTVTCAILQSLVERGLKVSSFKSGPDYIDPMFHSKVIGTKSRNLDGCFCDKNTLRFLLKKNALDISVIEGVMGFYDGVGEKASSHSLSLDTETPVIIVVDCKGMSLSIGAVMKGFLEFRRPNNIVGFIFNRLPISLADRARDICKSLNTGFFGYFPYSRDCSIESRHLGLVTAGEILDLQEKMHKLAETAEKTLLIDEIIRTAEAAPKIQCRTSEVKKITEIPLRIGVAYDKAFCFYYEDNFALLEELGCEIVKFSPLSDSSLPNDLCGLIFGGGYPELCADALSANKLMLNDVLTKIKNKIPTIAECGGFMYLHKTLVNEEKKRYNMVGAIDGEIFPTGRLCRFGYISLTAESENLICRRGDRILAHEFHYWDSSSCGTDFNAVRISSGASYKAVHADDSLYAGFPHLHFYSNPAIAVNFVKKCLEYRENNEQNQ